MREAFLAKISRREKQGDCRECKVSRTWKFKTKRPLSHTHTPPGRPGGVRDIAAADMSLTPPLIFLSLLFWNSLLFFFSKKQGIPCFFEWGSSLEMFNLA